MSSTSSEKKKKKKANGKISRVHPSSQSENESVEMNGPIQYKPNNTSKLKSVASVLTSVANVKDKYSKWRHYISERRSVFKRKEMGDDDSFIGRKCGGKGLDEIDDGFVNSPKKGKSYSVEHNRSLIHYFAQLSDPNNGYDTIDLDYLESLFSCGARVDCTDKYGQTILHEVARAWHVDVACFLMHYGADINQADNYGRTPLHVAAAVDYPEMVNFLIENGANKEAKTKGELQTPVHFAARNDACLSLKALIKKDCQYKIIRDYKGRTPLHLAAELDRSETAHELLEAGAPAGVKDNSGQAAIVWMITKMAPRAKEALDQFHVTDRANRKQYFYLNHLEPREPGDSSGGCPRSAMQAITMLNQFDLVMHPVVLRLIEIKWRKFGQFGAWLTLILNFFFASVWTTVGIVNSMDYHNRHHYVLPDEWWRIMLLAFGTIAWIWQIKDEVQEVIESNRTFKKWKKWRMEEIEKDIEFSHPRWPEEEDYFQQEKHELDDMGPNYFNDFWNINDWICYAMLFATMTIHVFDVFMHTEFIARLHIQFFSITVIVMWLRLMKNARAFALLGPFIVMLGHMISDVARFLFLYVEFYIPFSCAFWMIFGGVKLQDDSFKYPNPHKNITVMVDGFHDPNMLMFSMFRMTLVDEYAYEDMKKADYVMADILVGAWMGFSAILCLNLLIALLSETFTRVYDNAQANAMMQKAINILNTEEGMSTKRREKFRVYIHNECKPYRDFYDDDLTVSGEEDLKKVTFQIKDQLEELKEQLEHQRYSPLSSSPGGGNDGGGSPGSGINTQRRKVATGDELGDISKQMGNKNIAEESCVTVEKFENEIDVLREEVREIRDRQDDLMDRFKKDVKTMKTLLQQIAANMPPAASPRSLLPPLERSGSRRSKSSERLQSSSRESELEWQMDEKQRRKEAKRLRRQMHEQLMASMDMGTDDDKQPLISSPSRSRAPTVEVATEYSTSNLEQRATELPAVRMRPTVLNMEKMPSSEA